MVFKDLADSGTYRYVRRGSSWRLNDGFPRLLGCVRICLQSELDPCDLVQRLLENSVNPVQTNPLEHLSAIALVETRGRLLLGTDLQRRRGALWRNRRDGLQAFEDRFFARGLPGQMPVELFVAFDSTDLVTR